MKKVVIVNDILGGCLGEKKVFWNYMLDSIPGLIGIDRTIVNENNFQQNVQSYIDTVVGDCLVIQNATFIPKVHPNMPTIMFLQDNLRSMGRRDNQQEHNISHCTYVVANSNTTKESYNECVNTIIPIGIDEQHFNKRETVPIDYDVGQYDKVGIFVGAFNDVKGWGQVLETIRNRPDVFFICVSKHEGDVCNEPNVKVFNKIDQDTLVNLLSIADFFILGSPVETQCLAALEANFCGLPVIMNNTGIYMDWDDRDTFGVFGKDFSESIDIIYSKTWNTRSFIMNKGLSISAMIDKWKTVIAKFGGYCGI